MRTASVSKLKASLSAYLHYVMQGEEVMITDRGRPIARLTSIRFPPGSPEHMEDLVRRGVVRMGTGKLPKGFWSRPRPKVPSGVAVKAILDEREESQ
jgi:prevent-host-death family protein